MVRPADALEPEPLALTRLPAWGALGVAVISATGKVATAKVSLAVAVAPAESVTVSITVTLPAALVVSTAVVAFVALLKVAMLAPSVTCHRYPAKVRPAGAVEPAELKLTLLPAKGLAGVPTTDAIGNNGATMVWV